MITISLADCVLLPPPPIPTGPALALAPPPPFEQQLNLVDVMGGGGAAAAAEEEEERCYHCSQLASTAQTGDGSKERGEEREGSIYNIVGLMALRLGWLPRSIRTRFWGRRNLVE